MTAKQEAQVGLFDQALEGKLPDQQLGSFSVAAALSQSHGTRSGTTLTLTGSLVANCFRGTFPPVNLQTACLVLADIGSLSSSQKTELGTRIS